MSLEPNISPLRTALWKAFQPRFGRLSPLILVWLGFSVSVFSFCLLSLVGEGLGPLGMAFQILGSTTCGLAWLLTRYLFRPSAGREVWPLLVVGFQFFVGALLIQVEAVNPSAIADFLVLRLTENFWMLTSSTVLFLPLIEVFAGYGASLERREKRFRHLFLAGYGLTLGFGVIWLRQSADGSFADQWGDMIRLICASLALFLATAAVRFRTRHPLSTSRQRPNHRVNVTDDLRFLAARVEALLQDEAVLTRSDLKLADLARLTGEADYKVTQAITGVLGYANFNRLINHHRVELVKVRLCDKSLSSLPVLTIAMDCGFGSIGPFNRAFREAVGQTPTEYRSKK